MLLPFLVFAIAAVKNLVGIDGQMYIGKYLGQLLLVHAADTRLSPYQLRGLCVEFVEFTSEVSQLFFGGK
ncbi:hypothetical protein DK871_20800 [Pseudomonas sp. L13]|nr:hypothetical protein [Pseudomonas sp. L13]